MHNNFNPNTFENSFVHDFYTKHSNEFNKSRINAWSFIPSFFKKYYKKNMIILDNGCGNGRNIIKNNTIAMDISKELLHKCKEIKILKVKNSDISDSNDNNVESNINDNDNININIKDNNNINSNITNINNNNVKTINELKTKIPIDLILCNGISIYFKYNTFDIILSISVIHHLSTEERRIEYLKECKRILKDKGYMLIYVWNIKIKYKSKFRSLKEYVTKDKDIRDINNLNGNIDNTDLNNNNITNNGNNNDNTTNCITTNNTTTINNDNNIFNDNDFIAIWNKKEEMKRYYHLFSMEEIEELCISVGLKILEKGYDKESIYLVLTK